jgi:small subunit ribosomal protein S1
VISGRFRLADFGAFVEVAPGVDGLVYRSEISYEGLSPGRFLNARPGKRAVLKIDEEPPHLPLHQGRHRL